MKPWTLFCAGLLPLLFTAGVSAATNRTIILGQIDSVADSSFIRLLDASQTEKAVSLPARARATERIAGRSIAEGVQLFPYAQQASFFKLAALPERYSDRTESAVALPKSDKFESYLMLGLAAGLIALHLRRKQKSLRQRPLAEVMYR